MDPKRILSLLLPLALLALAACEEQHYRPHHNFWEGQPAIAPGVSKGYFVWHDDWGWHVRWTTRGERHLFSGTLTCDGSFQDFFPVDKERGDYIRQVDRRTIRFETRTSAELDGFDFRLSPGVERVTFDLEVDGYRVNPALVKLGAQKNRPPGVPFTLDRR